jgi:hypothetical protein
VKKDGTGRKKWKGIIKEMWRSRESTMVET